MTKLYWFDEEKRKFIPGAPPCRVKKYGQAPYVIGDRCERFYHHGAQVYIDSKSMWKSVDRVCGTITEDKPLPSLARQKNKERELALKRDGREALHKALAQLDAGTAPLNENTREICKKENERISNIGNFDAFNVAGRKNDPRGKKYRR